MTLVAPDDVPELAGGAFLKPFVKKGVKNLGELYDSLKGKTTTTAVKTEEEIADEAFKLGKKFAEEPYISKTGRKEGSTLGDYGWSSWSGVTPYNEKKWDEALRLRTKFSKEEEVQKLKKYPNQSIKEFDDTPYYHGSQVHNIKRLSLHPEDKKTRELVEDTFGSYSNKMWVEGIYITKNVNDAKLYGEGVGAVYKVNHKKGLKIFYEGQPDKNKISKKVENAFFAHLTRLMKEQNGKDYPTITKGSNSHMDGKWEDFKEKNSLHSSELMTYGNGRDKSRFYQEAGYDAVDSSSGAIHRVPGTMHTNELIILNPDDLIIRETKNIKKVGIDKFKKGGTLTTEDFKNSLTFKNSKKFKTSLRQMAEGGVNVALSGEEWVEENPDFDYSKTSDLNRRYLEHYHNNILDNNLQSVDETGKTNTMLLSTIERDGKYYILPSYDPLTQSQIQTASEIYNLNKEAVENGLSVGYPSEEIAQRELNKLRTSITEDREKNLRELEEFDDRPPSNWFEGLLDEDKDSVLKNQEEKNLEEQMEKILERGDPAYSMAEGGTFNNQPYDLTDYSTEVWPPDKNFIRYLVGQGLALGIGDELEAFVRSKLGDKTYKENISTIKSEMKKYKEENPATALGAEIVGGIGTGWGIYKGLGKLGMKGWQRLVGSGAVETGTYAAGAPEHFLGGDTAEVYGGTKEDRIMSGLLGTGVGAAIGPIFGGAVGTVKYVGKKVFELGDNMFKSFSSTAKRNIINNMPEGEGTGSAKLFHTDSGHVPEEAMPYRPKEERLLEAGAGEPSYGLYHIPLTKFIKNQKLSLALDKDYSKSYAMGLGDPEGTIGFLYEVSIPKNVLKNLFDPFNERHIRIFKRRVMQMLEDGDITEVGFVWNKVHDKDLFIQKHFINPMQLRQGNQGSSSVQLYQNYAILESKTVTHILKKDGFTGTWQKEGGWTGKGTGKEWQFDQIQIFDGSSVDIITANTKKVIRRGGKDTEDIRLELDDYVPEKNIKTAVERQGPALDDFRE